MNIFPLSKDIQALMLRLTASLELADGLMMELQRTIRNVDGLVTEVRAVLASVTSASSKR